MVKFEQVLEMFVSSVWLNLDLVLPLAILASEFTFDLREKLRVSGSGVIKAS